MTKAKVECVHYWIVNERNVGSCTKCGEVRDFAELQNRKRLEQAARLSAAAQRRETNHKS